MPRPPRRLRRPRSSPPRSRRPRRPSSRRRATRRRRRSVSARPSSRRRRPPHRQLKHRQPKHRQPKRRRAKRRRATAPPSPTPASRAPRSRRAPSFRRVGMAEYSAKEIAALRKSTGAGMMDCKQALEESDGDLEAAVDWLRAKGLSKANKLQERDATEGAVDVLVDGNVGVIVELNCNTDFVAKGAAFTGLLADITKQVA